MVRVEIRLPEPRYRRLRLLAHQQHISLAELIRRLIDDGLRADRTDRAARYDRAAALVGAFRAKEDDLSDKRDRYLAARPS